jgi:ankyrin repeat protein
MADSFPIRAVTEGNEADLVHILKTYAKSTRKVADSQGNTVLHLALVNDKTDFVKVLLNNVRGMKEKHYSNDLQMTEWVNEVNQDGYSALHLSVSKGNLVRQR